MPKSLWNQNETKGNVCNLEREGGESLKSAVPTAETAQWRGTRTSLAELISGNHTWWPSSGFLGYLHMHGHPHPQIYIMKNKSLKNTGKVGFFF